MSARSADELKLDYPEHLNPFRHRRNTLAQSFRGLKKALVRSFTGKDKDKPTIRPKPEPTATRNVMSMPPEYSEPQILFPRSRFSERLSKRDPSRTASVTASRRSSETENNPFEGKHENNLKSHVNADTPIGISPKPAERKLRRKKKAPVPPGSISGSVNESKWSLASTDSEMSSLCYSESEIDYVLNNNVNEKNEEIFKITREIVKFAEDTNNNNISDQVENEKRYEDNTSKERIVDANDDKKDDKLDEQVQSINVRNIEQNTREEEVVDSSVTNVNKSTDRDNTIDEHNQTLVSELKTSSAHDDSGFVEDDRNLSESNNFTTTVIVETSESSCIQSIRNENKHNEEEEEEKDVPVQQVVHTTESRLSVKGTVDFFESTYSPSPSPKMRKNILTKENLLGSESI